MPAVRSRHRGRVTAAIVIVALVAAVTALVTLTPSTSKVADRISGVVIGPAGQPIVAARVSVPGQHAVTDAQGRFELSTGPTWVTVRARGWLPRTRAAGGGAPVVVRLARNRPGTVSFAFGGDVMFGRRFYDPHADGSRTDALLTDSAGVEDHLRLLDGVAPVLRDADIAAVNLETPLAPQPYPDPRAPRPPTFHPTKEFAFASAPSAADALAEAGIDVVDLGNNHLYDRLESGVISTRQALEGAGFGDRSGFFGAGQSAQQAWAPAIRTVHGQRVAFLGCTSILGDDEPISYVTGRGKGGAAACAPRRLRSEVKAAARSNDIVVVMIHGGYEYGRTPSTQVRSLSDVAVSAGATLVINHHPHVVGGLRFADGALTAWTMGNLLFDQTVWPTFESYVLRVAVRHGTVVSAWTEPLRIENYQPTGVFGADASWVSRGTGARSEGPWVSDNGSLWLDPREQAVVERRTVAGPGIEKILSGCSATGTGRELLWSGDFEGRRLTEPPSFAAAAAGSGAVADGSGAAAGVGAHRATAPLWNVDRGHSSRVWSEDAAQHGRGGVELTRSAGSTQPVVLTPQHRVLVGSQHELTFLLGYRASGGSPRAEVRLSWYNDTNGASQATTVTSLGEVGDSWRTLRVDVQVPLNAVAVQPFIALAPAEGRTARLQVDDVALVDWNEPGCDYLRGPGQLIAETLPGSSKARTIDVATAGVPLLTPAPLPAFTGTPTE